MAYNHKIKTKHQDAEILHASVLKRHKSKLGGSPFCPQFSAMTEERGHLLST